jgi:hypothetical protein
MSPLAEAVYELLRWRTSLEDPRLSYAHLAEQLRAVSDEFEFVHHRSRPLYAALNEVGRACRRLHLPPLPALVVRADTRRPGEAYYECKGSRLVSRGDKIAAWRRDLEAVKRSTYPPCASLEFQRARG